VGATVEVYCRPDGALDRLLALSTCDTTSWRLRVDFSPCGGHGRGSEVDVRLITDLQRTEDVKQRSALQLQLAGIPILERA
jgi:hypothetical protein